MDGDFLSEIIDFDEIGVCGYLNLIVSPCGSGKTTLALNHLAPMYGNPARSLYLIDTVAGQDQLLQNPKFRCYDIGRYRNDVDLVYLYNSYIWDDIILPNEMLNTPLYKEDVDNYIEKLDIRDEQGHLMKQPTFLKHITMWDYEVQAKKKKGGKRYHIISKINTGTQN